jgi:hypothetical protein
MSRTATSTTIPAAPRACAWRTMSSPTAPNGAGSGMVITNTSPGRTEAKASCTARLSPWPHRTVRAGPAARLPGITCLRSTSTIPSPPAASQTVAVPKPARSRRGPPTASLASHRPHHLRNRTLERLGVADLAMPV